MLVDSLVQNQRWKMEGSYMDAQMNVALEQEQKQAEAVIMTILGNGSVRRDDMPKTVEQLAAVMVKVDPAKHNPVQLACKNRILAYTHKISADTLSSSGKSRGKSEKSEKAMLLFMLLAEGVTRENPLSKMDSMQLLDNATNWTVGALSDYNTPVDGAMCHTYLTEYYKNLNVDVQMMAFKRSFLHAGFDPVNMMVKANVLNTVPKNMQPAVFGYFFFFTVMVLGHRLSNQYPWVTRVKGQQASVTQELMKVLRFDGSDGGAYYACFMMKKKGFGMQVVNNMYCSILANADRTKMECERPITATIDMDPDTLCERMKNMKELEADIGITLYNYLNAPKQAEEDAGITYQDQYLF